MIKVLILILCPLLIAGLGPHLAAEEASTDKTLVAWVSLADLQQRGGSALTIQSGDRFDAIVFGEKALGRWMAGSNFFRRTQPNQADYPAETADDGTFVQMAIVYDQGQIRIYRNARLYVEYRDENIDLLNVDNQLVVFGLRHIGAGSGSPLQGEIDDARIYARALTQEEIAALKPNEPGKIKPLAWWDFEKGQAVDRTGRFPHSQPTGEVKIDNGRLILDGKGYFVAARSEADARLATRANNPRAPFPPYLPETPSWPKNPPADWLTYHLAHPGPGNAFPGDPNCIFDHKGRYHLHYIYRNRTGFAFAHVSSDDMLHWKWHPTVLAPPNTGHGMFSGTGFYAKDGTPAIIYHGEGSGRNWIQYAQDDALETWSEPTAVLPKTADGKVPNIRHWDPDCWRNGEWYYALSGGHNPQLMKSKNLKNWEYLGDFLHPDYPKDLGVAKGEDISCANVFRIGDKWMLLCISHRLGCRYYLGDFKDEKFLPTSHAMMSFGSNMFFAPESVLTKDGRRVMWAWLLNAPVAPTGVQSLPRELELTEDGELLIRSLRELASLRGEEKEWEQVRVRDGVPYGLKGLTGDALEFEVKVKSPLPEQFGVALLADDKGKNGVRIIAGGAQDTLQVGGIDVPFTLQADEDLTLRIFVDKNLIEVFVNDRQAAAFVHKHVRKNPNASLFSAGGDSIAQIKVWNIGTIYNEAAEAK